MRGIELAQKFYEQFGEPMLNEQFYEVLPFLAIGLVGSGSECLGFDDELSKDHDFEPAFCIFLPDEDIVDRRTAFLLERAYTKLPSSFLGVERSRTSPVGNKRHGVIRMGDFFEEKTGHRDGRLTLEDWLSIPEYSLLEAVNGSVFADNYGEFTKIRESLRSFPEDVRLKRLAGNLLLMGQSGQYNYGRCASRGETAAAQLAAFEFVKSALHVIFLLNRTYMPYYKWSFRALKGLPKLGLLADRLEYLISSGNSPSEAAKKQAEIEDICAVIAQELRSQGLTALEGAEVERQAYIVNDAINDSCIRNLNILCAV